MKRKEDMKMQKLKGLWIPAEILLGEKLTDKEKLILSKNVIYKNKNKNSRFFIYFMIYFLYKIKF